MQVNVFITRENGQLQNKLLVLAINPKVAIPTEFRLGWVYYATVSTGDRMFGDTDASTWKSRSPQRDLLLSNRKRQIEGSSPTASA